MPCAHAHGLAGKQCRAIHREALAKVYDVHGAELQGLHVKVFQADQWASAGAGFLAIQKYTGFACTWQFRKRTQKSETI